MATFGSFALLLALVLCAYNLFAGAIALRQLSTGHSGRVSPERLAETARRAGIGSFFAVSAPPLRLLYAAFTNDFSDCLHPAPLQPGASGAVQVRGAVVRTGGFAAAVGVAAGGVWICAAAAP